MADSIKIIDPYDSYEIQPQSQGEGFQGDNIINNVQSMEVGFGSRVLRIDRTGMWLGAADFASAPFSVDMNGNMVATSLGLSNYLQVGDALADVQGDIFDLADIDTDLGVILAGTLIGVEVRGSLIRTSTSGGRVEIDDTTDNIEIYDTGGTKRVELDNDEILFFNSSGAERGGITANTTEIYVTANNGGNLHLEALGSAYTIIFSIAGVIRGYFTQQGLNMNNNDILNVDVISGNTNTIDFTNSTEVTIDEEFSPSANNAHDLGEPTNIWNDIYVSDVNYDTLTLMSDRREKENILPSSYGLAEILALEPVNYNYKAKTVDETEMRMIKQKARDPQKYARVVQKAKAKIKERSARKHIGFIAQDVAPIMPELIRQNKAGTYVMQQNELIPVLVNAIKELSAEVDKLKQ